MAGTMAGPLLYVCLCVALSCFTSTAGQECVACTYTFAGTGTTDRECVSDPYRHVHARNVSCDFYNHTCRVRAVYSSVDFTRILSLARDCLATSGSPTGISCDNNLQPTCVRYCRTHLCNDQDGDLHKRISPPDDGGTGVTSLLRSSVFLVVCSWLIPSVVK